MRPIPGTITERPGTPIPVGLDAIREGEPRDPLYLTREELEDEVRSLRARLANLIALEEGDL